MTTPSNDFDINIPVYSAIPEEWESAREFLTEQLRVIANGVNDRDFAYYLDTLSDNSQSWFPGTGTELRSILRKVVDIGGLPDFGATPTKSVAHGITTSEDTRITRFYGTANDPGVATLTSGIPLPHVDVGGNNIEIEIDSTNIKISGTGDYSAYTTAYVVIEFLDEA